MLTGRAAELRPWINYLHTTPITLVSPAQARAEAMARPAAFETAETLKTRGRMANRRRHAARKTRDAARAALCAERGVTMIPTSGAARRRAKAIRNREAVEEMTAARQYLRNHDGQRSELRLSDAARPGLGLLAEILAWCADHPATYPLDEAGPLTMHREDDGTITVEGDAPETLAISADLLDAASPEYLTFADGVLAVHVQPETLHYRALGPDPRSHVVVFECVREA